MHFYKETKLDSQNEIYLRMCHFSESFVDQISKIYKETKLDSQNEISKTFFQII